LARLLVQSGKIELAIPHLHELLRQVDVFRLEEWEPDLATLALKAAYEGFIGFSDTKDSGKQIFDRIVKINPVAALGLLKG
jgi:hypothetical protein